MRTLRKFGEEILNEMFVVIFEKSVMHSLLGEYSLFNFNVRPIQM